MGMEQHPTFEGGQDIRERSFEYACQIVDFCQRLSEAGGVGRLMVPQLLSCSLSFPAMLEEARSAESDADFLSKCCIGLKEARESWMRMRVCQRCRIGPQSGVNVLVGEGNELIAIVTTIIKNKRRSVASQRAAMKAEQRRRASKEPAARAATRQARSDEFQIPDS
jgi:four helix bundle protein